MISIAPSSLTAGDSVPRATRSTAATMGAKRSSMARTVSMADSGPGGGDAAWGTLGVIGGAGGGREALRFTRRLSHATIPAHGLPSLARAGAIPRRAARVARRQFSRGLGKIRAELKNREAQAAFLIDWQRKLHAAGYVGLQWPAAYGGRGATLMGQALFYEEMARARAPELPNAIGLDMAGPALMTHATESQKRLHLPRILSAE